MKTALIVFLFVVTINWTYQAFLSYGESYCNILNWDASTMGFKVGCVASQKAREFLTNVSEFVADETTLADASGERNKEGE